MDNCAIILAGGNGARFGEKKQFINFFGKPLWKHVYDKTVNFIDKKNIITVGIDIEGGETRTLSVKNGLKYFEQKKIEYNKVIILEAARPLVTDEQIKNLLFHEDESVTYAMPLVNTPIMRNGTYVNRDDYYDLLTPQSFNFNLLLNAYKNLTSINYTDETKVMYDYYNIKPSFILNGQNLVKLTYVKDLPLLEKLYLLQKEGVI